MKMKLLNTLNLKKSLTLVLAIVLIGAISFGAFAFFSDRASTKLENISTATFVKDDNAYSISRTYNNIPYIAGEDIKVTVSENNGKSETVESVVTMKAAWESKVPNSSPFGNAKAEDNATITVGGTSVDYSYDSTSGAITFTLPSHELTANATNKQREVVFHIPESLASTGTLNFTFEHIELTQSTAMGAGFSMEFSHDELNADASNPLDFSAEVVWDLGPENNKKSVIGRLSGTSGDYSLDVTATDSTGTMRNWAGEDASKQSAFKDSITSITLGEDIENIGDYAFAGFKKVSSITIPADVETIGISAFNGAGLTGELTIPANVKTIESLAFANLTNVDEITFGHSAADTLSLPDTAGNNGAFYVSSHKDTVINSNNEKIMYGYGWHDGKDNRRLIPTMKATDTWQDAAIDSTKLKTINIVDHIWTNSPPATSWDASDPSAPGTVTAYLSADKETLTLAGNGYGLIFANEASDDAFYGLSAVTSINGTDILDTRNVTSMSYMFSGNESLASLDVSSWNVSKVTTMEKMFEDCESLKSINLAKNERTAKDGSGAYTAWNPTSLETIFGMFSMYGTDNGGVIKSIDVTGWETKSLTEAASFTLVCYDLTEVKGIEDWDMSNVTTTRYMFYQAHSLENLDVSKWEITSELTDTYGMFYYCKKLKAADISKWDMSNVTKNEGMFEHCEALTSLTLPASLTVLEDSFATHCTSLTTINFLQAAGTDITFPTAGASAGAFYVPSYLETAFSFNGNADAQNYAWSKDNRMPLPILAEQDTWFRTYTGDGTTYTTPLDESLLTSITFVDRYTPSANETSWDASIYSTGPDDKEGPVTAYLSADKTSLTIAGNGYGSIFANPDSSGAFANLEYVTAINSANLLNTSNATNMAGMFYRCKSLKTLNVGNWKTSNVEDMSYMFSMVNQEGISYNYDTLTLNVKNWNVSNVKNMQGMFSGLLDVSTLNVGSWETGNVEDMSYMFQGTNLQSLNLTDWDTGNVKDMSYMFVYSHYFTSALDVSKWNTSNVETMEGMFNYGPYDDGYETLTLDISKWNVTNVKTMEEMFFGFTGDTLDMSQWTTSSLTNTAGMFASSEFLANLNVSGIDTSKVTNMSRMFAFCPALESLDVSHFDTRAITASSGLDRFAYRCIKLDDIKLGTNFGQSGKLPTHGEDTGMFYLVNRMLTKVTGANSVMMDYLWRTDNRGGSVTVTTATGGTASAWPRVAINGQTITLTDTPASNYEYNGATVSYTDETGAAQTITLDKDTKTFIMPFADVTVTPKWESTVIAQAIYSADDNSLTFILDKPYKAGDTYNNKAVTNVYTGFETAEYTAESIPEWSAIAANVTSVLVKDEMKPVSTAGWFKGFTNCSSFDVTKLNTAKVTNMSSMFEGAGNLDTVTAFSITGMDNWDTSKVTSMNSMFLYTGAYAQNLSIGSLSNWDTSSVKDMKYMFAVFHAYGADNVTLDLSKWNTSNVENMVAMFNGTGYYASTFNLGDLGTKKVNEGTADEYTAWNVSKVKDMEGMFNLAGFASSSWNIGSLDDWDTSAVTNMKDMFKMTGGYASTWSIGDLSNWNTGAVENMESMFNYAANSAATFNLGDLSNWDVSNVKNFGKLESVDEDGSYLGTGMFYATAKNATTWNIGSLRNWNTSNAEYMGTMFAGSAVSGLDLTQWNTEKVTDMAYMFYGCTKLDSLDFSSFNTNAIASAEGLKQFAAFCNGATEIKLGANFGQSKNIPASGDRSGLFTAEYPTPTKVTGANDLMLDYDWVADNRYYTVTVSSVTGGTVTADVTGAINGKTITLTTTASSGYEYEGATITYTDMSGASQTINLDVDTKTFTMPDGNVTVTPKWVNAAPVAQAVLTADNTLTFIREPLYSVGGTFEGKNITAVYTGLETATYNYNTVPWLSKASSITKVVFKDEIKPRSTAYWFRYFFNCSSFDVTNLNTSNVTNMAQMFDAAGTWASSVTFTGLNNWNVGNVTNMLHMFAALGNLDATSIYIGNLSNWNVRNVKDMSGMFQTAGLEACTNFTLSGLENWNTSSVQDMRGMFLSCAPNASYKLNLSGWNVSNVTSYDNFNGSVTTKVTAPAFGSTYSDDEPAFELPEGVTQGAAQAISEMPDVAALNKAASANAPEGTELYAWLVNSGLNQMIIELADFEDTLLSVYSDGEAYDLTITPLYQAVQESEEETTEPTEPSKETESTEATKPCEEATEPSEPDVTEPSNKETKPEENASEPATEPSEEATEPTQESKPTEPSKPSEPATEPSEEATQPASESEPTDPSEEATEPSQPEATNLEEDTTVPSEEPTEPSAETTSPTEPSEGESV